MKLNERLRQLRARKKLKQIDVANHIGVDRSTYSKYETGDSNPDYNTLCVLADFFNVSSDYLLGRTDVPQNKIVAKEDLPSGLARYVDYIEILKDYSVEDISPEELREVIEFAKKIKNKA